MSEHQANTALRTSSEQETRTRGDEVLARVVRSTQEAGARAVLKVEVEAGGE